MPGSQNPTPSLDARAGHADWLKSFEALRNKRHGSEKYLGAECALRLEMHYVLGDPSWTDATERRSAVEEEVDDDRNRRQAKPAYRHSLADLFKALHAKPAGERPQALCLSGGGIRSATFSLGVLQWLAGRGKLEDYHYLSTVSGGGYIGSWLVNALWRQGHPQGKAADLPGPAASMARTANAKPNPARDWLHRLGHSAGTAGAAQATGAARLSDGDKDPVAPLRAYSNYLSPTGGLSTDAFSLAAIFVRNFLLNALVWLPLLAALVGLVRLYVAALTGGPALNPVGMAQWWPLWAVLVLVALGIAYIVADLPPAEGQQAPTSPNTPSDQFSWACFWPITAAAVLLSLLGGWMAPLHKQDLLWFAAAGALAHLLGLAIGVPLRQYGRKLARRPTNFIGVLVVVLVGAAGGCLTSLVLSHLGQGTVAAELAASQRLLYATFAVPAMTGAFWLAMALQAGVTGRVSSEEDREWWARATAAWLKFTLIWVAVFALFVWVPLAILEHAADAGLTAVQFGISGGVLGVLTSLMGYWSKTGTQIKSKARSVIRLARLKLLDVMAGLVLVVIVLALTLAWNAVLDRCHGWKLSRTVCSTDLHAQTEFLREQVRMGAAAGASGLDGAGARVVAPVADAVSADLAALGHSAGAQVYAHVLLNSNFLAVGAAILLLLVLSFFMAFCMGANQFSLHGMYGNRLVRAFLGSGRNGRSPHWFTGFDRDDNPPLADLKAPLQTQRGCPRLYPLVNIALNLVRPSRARLQWQQRKAASFIATPLHCGASYLGFRPTDKYAGGMSLGRAMTISGAAASPNMGYHSSPLVTFVMTLFNVRLGWWAPNPARNKRWSERKPELGPTFLRDEAMGWTGDETDFVYLSDGGHFDNTGIYEMVRRRCRCILAVDATCDGEYKWTDLIDVVRKIRVDLGIPIELPAVLPGAGRESPHPRWVEAPILYSQRDGCSELQDGTLIVLKPMLLPTDPPELAAYAADSAPEGGTTGTGKLFPHQSTADQFYDEQQFESYRLLGYLTAQAALSEKGLAGVQAKGASTDAGTAGGAMAPGVAEATGGNDAPPPREGFTMPGLVAPSGMGLIAQQMGSSMALAAALTVGGTLGVAGSVALQPAQVSLSAEDKALLKEGYKIQTDAAGLNLGEEDRNILQAGMRITLDEESARRLADAAQKLDVAIGRLVDWKPPPMSGTVALDETTLRQLGELRDAIKNVDGTVAPLTVSITNLHRTLDKLQAQPTLTGDLNRSINELKQAVNEIGPRRNIRGQDGGAR